MLIRKTCDKTRPSQIMVGLPTTQSLLRFATFQSAICIASLWLGSAFDCLREREKIWNLIGLLKSEIRWWLVRHKMDKIMETRSTDEIGRKEMKLLTRWLLTCPLPKPISNTLPFHHIQYGNQWFFCLSLFLSLQTHTHIPSVDKNMPKNRVRKTKNCIQTHQITHLIEAAASALSPVRWPHSKHTMLQ